MKVLVNGVGNIGTTVMNILYDYKDLLGINDIYALKNGKISSWNLSDLEFLDRKGIIVCTKEKSKYEKLDRIIGSIDYIFDCNSNTIGLKNKAWYSGLPNLKGCCSQGSEKGFGIPFMSGINNKVITDQKFVQVVSCNTHSLVALLHTISNNTIENITQSDFVIVRRSEDIGNHERLVTANVVSRHLDKQVGTHHAIDVNDLFQTTDTSVQIQSSDITTPSQLMHTVRFNIGFLKSPEISEINDAIESNPLMSFTSKFDSNIIFELGRRYSPYGRLYSHAIINNNNLLLDKTRHSVKGWAFIPQEGNTIISTVHAFLLQTGNKNSEQILDTLKNDLIQKEW
jgi:glyceraldehyde-3-phosphate dehydrogenase (NAD(P))